MAMDKPRHETPVTERRITVRLLSYWERLRKGQTMPSEQDIDPEDLKDVWDYCFLVHVKDLGKSDYNYTYLGDAIAAAYRGQLTADDCNGLISIHAGKMFDHYQKIIDSHKPLLDEGKFTNLHGDTIKFRQCLLPLGEGDRVDAIFGGMRFKVFAP